MDTDENLLQLDDINNEIQAHIDGLTKENYVSEKLEIDELFDNFKTLADKLEKKLPKDNEDLMEVREKNRDYRNQYNQRVASFQNSPNISGGYELFNLAIDIANEINDTQKQIQITLDEDGRRFVNIYENIKKEMAEVEEGEKNVSMIKAQNNINKNMLMIPGVFLFIALIIIILVKYI